MEWISSLFLTGYGQRSRTSFFNKCIKKSFGFSPINVEIILNTKTRLNDHGSSASFSYSKLFPHLLVKIQNSFYACVEEGCFASLKTTVVLIWKPRRPWRNYRKGLLESFLRVSHFLRVNQPKLPCQLFLWVETGVPGENPQLSTKRRLTLFNTIRFVLSFFIV